MKNKSNFKIVLFVTLLCVFIKVPITTNIWSMQANILWGTDSFVVGERKVGFLEFNLENAGDIHIIEDINIGDVRGTLNDILDIIYNGELINFILTADNATNVNVYLNDEKQDVFVNSWEERLWIVIRNFLLYGR